MRYGREKKSFLSYVTVKLYQLKVETCPKEQI